MKPQLAIAVSLLGVVIVVVLQKLRKRSAASRLPLPPGPPQLPFIGNALDISTEDMPATLREMSSKYGDITYLNIFGQPLIVLGSHEAATDLLEKRSANYSDRPSSVIAGVSGADFVFATHPYGTRWRTARRTFYQHFSPTSVLQYAPTQRLETHRLIFRLIEEPDKFLLHIRRFFGSSIMRVAYGMDVDEERTDFLKIAEDAMVVLALELEFGRHIVETFPILRFLPSWMPGAGYKRDCARWRRLLENMVDAPWERAKTAVAEGTARLSMATSLITELDSSIVNSVTPSEHVTVQETAAKNVTAVAYAGGADTTLSTVQSFFLAMASHPEVQKKAQEELDAVVGSDRLPEFGDMESLPYVRALVKESLRWRNVGPLGFPHRSMEDDEYRGYFIPKGSILLANIQAFSRNPGVYPNPDAFMPERFLKDDRLDPDVCDPTKFVFGYGRRICPGRHYAEAALFIIAASVLHTLSIAAPLDEHGKPIHLEGKMTHGLVSYPEPFECVIKPRSQEAEALIRKSCGDFSSLS